MVKVHCSMGIATKKVQNMKIPPECLLGNLQNVKNIPIWQVLAVNLTLISQIHYCNC